MKKITLILLCAILTSCSYFKGEGTLTGNCFNKSYLDYEWITKPDVGADVTLYSLDNIDLKYKTKSDIQGNYKIDKIPAGEYFLIIESSNRKTNPHINYYYNFQKLKDNNELMKKIFGFDIEKYKVEIDEIERLYKLYDDALSDSILSNHTDLVKQIEDKGFDLIIRIHTDFGHRLPYLFVEIHFEVITIEKDKETSIVARL